MHSDHGEPYLLAVTHELVTDSRLSSADVGVYMRCRWLTDICAPYGDLDWLIAELRMRPEETRASVRRLVELGYLHTVGQAEVEAITARAVAERVREGIETTMDDLTPAERTAVARFADLVDRRRDEAVAAMDAETDRELGLG
ncbi:hypothetical protein [Streptomyces tanashiensis]|uniref:hypothetical protein n=1 Tax=Streptomyces tanashiensis TaxID=67367 RepID=UPI00167A8103|nr:hypothetical protein [Streptomyces tanashiensis]